MDSSLLKFLKEPLFQFLAAGAALFVLAGFLDESGHSDSGDKRIVVTPERIEQLRAGWLKTRQRPPTGAELRGLIEHYVNEELLYREGVAMGLDKDDTVIRRRVAQKVEFLVEDLAAAKEPTNTELEKYFREHAEWFLRPPRATFEHVYFSTDRRGPQAEADVGRLLRRTAEGGGPPSSAGDAFLLDHRYADATRDRLARDFGDEFADAIFQLPEGEWRGPVRSAYGVHLVRVEERTDAVLPPFDEVRDKVRTQYIDERRRQQNEAIIREMRERYEVVVQGESASAGQDEP